MASSRCLIKFCGSEDFGKNFLVNQLAESRRISSGQVCGDKELREFIKVLKLMNPENEWEQKRIHGHRFVPEFNELFLPFAHPPNYLL